MAPPARRRRPAVTLLVAAAVGASLVSCSGGPAPLRVGAVFPLSGVLSPLAADEALGVRIAVDMVNSGGGVAGRPLELVQRNLDSTASAPAVLDRLRADGVTAVVGAYSSDLSMAASAAAAHDNLLYWEAGAVADQVTGRGLPTVFRVGANGADLGITTGDFATTQLLPRLGRSAGRTRVSLVTADDAYAHSVSDAVRARLEAAGVVVVSESVYNPYLPRWGPVIADLQAARPDLLVLSSHIPDGISFRRAFLAAGLKVAAFLGSTMAQCLPDFGDALGADAVGVFASDRPEGNFNPAVLLPSARVVYDRFAATWWAGSGRAVSEEGLAGFSSAWALFHDVMPRAHRQDTAAIAAAARTVDLPTGSLPNGAGLRFSSDPRQVGQNLRASAVVWQWQAVRHSVVVWPPGYATGAPVVAAAG